METANFAAMFVSLCACIANGQAADQSLPAGVIVACAMTEPGLSLKTTAIRDPGESTA